MKVLTPNNTFFNYSQAKKLFLKYVKLINDIDDFCLILKSSQFFSFLSDNNEFIGCLYFYLSSDNKLMMNGFSNRKKHIENIQAIKLASSWFNSDIYAYTPHKTAAFCLLRAGFFKIDDHLYLLKKKGD